jgi:hypothetical protein
MRYLLALLLLLTAAACSDGGGDVLPEGWVQSGDLFYRADVDTTGLFPNLDNLVSMGILADTTYDQRDRAGWVARSLKRDMLVLYRNNPRLVDSVFDSRVPDLIAARDLSGRLQPVVDELESPVRRSLLQGFYPPSPLKKLGQDIPVPFPDSIRAQMEGERVRTQVALGADGFAQAVQILEPAHPTLERIAVGVIAQQKWNAGYVTLTNTNERVRAPSWVRYNILFGRPPAE